MTWFNRVIEDEIAPVLGHEGEAGVRGFLHSFTPPNAVKMMREAGIVYEVPDSYQWG